MLTPLDGRVFIGCILLILSACQPESPVEQVPAETAALDVEAGRDLLMQADRDFAAEAAARGIDGWMRYMAPDAIRLVLGEPSIHGLDAIREADTPLFETDSVRLAWEPVDGAVFADGRHGFTTGTYEVLQMQRDGAEAAVGQGAYITFWRQEPDGTWRIVLDGGAAGPPPDADP